MQLANDLLIRAALRKPVERTPVWLMRQAGRILPEYRKVREQAGDFKTLVTTPELAAEVTLQPVDILGVDAAIIFSDILVIPEAMGLIYEMEERKGPVFPKVISTEKDIEDLRVAQSGDLHYVLEAIALTKKELNGRVPLIGFAGAPWTIFSYMIEGGGSKTFSKAKKMLYTHPSLSHRLLEKITQSTINYLVAQVQAGANLIQVFDSWAGILGPEQYREFSLKYIREICEAIPDVPITAFAKGAFFAREEMNTLPCQVIGLDWNMDIAESRSMLADKVLQGNLDPCALYGSLADVRRETRNMLNQFKGHAHIANLGHGLYPDTAVDNVKCFIDTVKEFT
jgi:uroporphyrinogen decarboxylase